MDRKLGWIIKFIAILQWIPQKASYVYTNKGCNSYVLTSRGIYYVTKFVEWSVGFAQVTLEEDYHCRKDRKPIG